MKQENPWWTKLPVSTLESRPVNAASYHRGIYGVVAAFTLIIVAMVSFLVLGPDTQQPRANAANSISYPGDTASLIAQCGDTFTFNPERRHYGALPDDFFKDPNGGPGYIERRIPIPPMGVPAYGYFSNEDGIKFDKKFYISAEQSDTPQRSEYLKLMWDGWTIIWYDTKTDRMTTDAIAEFVNTHDKVVAMPWNLEVKIPQERAFAFSAWNTTRTCGLWDSDVAQQFIDFATEQNNARNKNDIPIVKLDADGEIPVINLEK